IALASEEVWPMLGLDWLGQKSTGIDAEDLLLVVRDVAVQVADVDDGVRLRSCEYLLELADSGLGRRVPLRLFLHRQLGFHPRLCSGEHCLKVHPRGFHVLQAEIVPGFRW